MKTFDLYQKGSKEKINSLETDNENNAKVYFSQIKNLPMGEFEKLFEIKERINKKVLI
jgi:hypothetical protein